MTKPAFRTVPVADIRVDPDINQRAENLDFDLVESYAADIRDWIASAPLVLFREPGTLWLADGFHRMAAAQRAGLTEVPAQIVEGDRRAAVLFAVGANRTHGARRTRADVQHALDTLLEDAEWAEQSDRWIAERVGVGHPTVAAARARLVSRWKDLPPEPGSCPDTTPRTLLVQVTKSAEPPREVRVTCLPDSPKPVLKPRVVYPDTPAPAPKRVGKDGKLYPVRPAPAPKPPRPVDALHVVQRVLGALADLADVDAKLVPEDRARLVAALQAALLRYDSEGCGHA